MRSRSFPPTRLLAVSAVVIGALALTACSSTASTSSSSSSATATHSSATIVAALSGDPVSLDSGSSSNALSIYTGQNIFEQLFALDKNYTVRPMLADSYKLSADALTYTIALRKDVPFQNGAIMTSADVKASLERWFKVSSNGINTEKNVVSLDTPDANTIVVNLKKPSYSFLSQLANQVQAAIIIPASIATAAGVKPLTTTQLIGTGPYKLGKYTAGVDVTLLKFAKYASRTENWGGLAGAKHAYAKELDYKFVTDASQRLSGLETGQWSWVDSIDADSTTEAASNPAVTIKTGSTGQVSTLLLNQNAASVFSSVDARLALNELVDKKAIATATLGSSKTWSLTPGMAVPNNKVMYSDAGKAVYSAHDVAAAKAAFAKAGVTSGKTIHILTTKTYPLFYSEAVIVQAELKAIGITAELSVYDFPTMIAKLSSDPTKWDISMTAFDGGVSAPSQVLWLGSTWPGEVADPTMQGLIDSYEAATTATAAHAIVDQVQTRVYQTMPIITIASFMGVGVYSSKLTLPGNWVNVLWNASLAS